MSLKVLVTGGCGMVGSEVVRQLLATGNEVRVLVRQTSRTDLLQDHIGDVEIFQGDVRNYESVESAMRGVSTVFHTAASMGFSGTRASRKVLFDVNIGGTATVVDAARMAGVERLVHTSSVAALGRPVNQTETINENIDWQPSVYNSDYAISKYRAELEVHRAVAEGLDAVIVNPSLIFGPARTGENTWQIVERVANRKIPAVPKGGTNVVDVRDVAAGHLLAMQSGKTGERYFLGSENLSWEAIFSTLAEALGVKPPARQISPRMAMLLARASETLALITRTTPIINRETARITGARFLYDNSKAMNELGCTFRDFASTASFLAEIWKKRHTSGSKSLKGS